MYQHHEPMMTHQLPKCNKNNNAQTRGQKMDTSTGQTAELLRVREVAKRFGLKESTIYRWVFDKKIQIIKVGTRSVRISSDEVDRIISAGTIESKVG